jgi:hypothetical protein
MHCTRLTIIAAAILLAGTQTAESGGPSKFIEPTLSGWEGLKEYWEYKDGAVIGSSPKGLKFNTFLCSRKKYSDFELSFQVRLKDGRGNSGVQIRSKIADPKVYAVAGPQCDMGDIYWGSLYGERFGGMMKQAPPDLVKKILKPKDFNDYWIRCVGNHVTIKLNGQVTVDDDFPKMPKEGIIAFQMHAGGPMEVTFRKIHFKELRSTKQTREKLPTPKEVAPVAKAPAPKAPAERIPAPASQPAASASQTGASEPEIYETPRRGFLQRLFQRFRRY